MPGYFVKPPRGSLLNRADPLAKGLVGAWLLNEKTGPKAYNAAGAEVGTLTGFALTGSTSNWTTGRDGGGLTFDGTNDYVTTGAATNPALKPTAFPVALGAVFTVSSLATARPVVSLGGNATTDAHTGFELLIQASGAVGIQAGYGATSGSATRRNLETTSGLITVGNRYVVLTVMDTATTGKIWINGVSYALSTSGTGSGTINYSTYDGVWIGRYGATAGGPTRVNFVGQIAAAFAWTGRTFTQRGASDFAADPFRMFRPRRVPVPLYVAAGGGGGNRRRRLLLCGGR